MERIKAQNLYKYFVDRRIEVEPLIDVSFEIERGELTVFTGPSGSGKTVVMNILAGFIKPDSGKLFFNGEDVVKWGWRKWNIFRNKYISYSPQRDMFIPTLSVIENVLFPVVLRGGDINMAKKKIDQLSRILGVHNLLNRRLYTLSGGERRRISVLRSLVLDVELYIFDEPTSGVDKDTVKVIVELIGGLADKDKMVVVSTHEEEFLDRGRSVYYLNEGRCVKLR